jgi:hypothetical protein
VAGPAIILLAAAIADAPLVIRGPSCGSDLYFHLTSWFEAQHSMLLGIPYPHWTPHSNLGTGEPRFVFYPPLTWMAGAAAGLILPWKSVAPGMTFLIFAAIGLANRALAGEVLADGPATMAGCAAIFAGFPLLTVYERADFAELTGSFWIPLLILFLLRDRNPAGGVWKRALDGSTAPLALVLAGAWLSNVPVGLMASYLLAAMAVAVALLERSWAPVVRATVGTVLAFGLAAIYLVPAAWEQPWANLQFAVSLPHFKVWNSWLFSHHTDMVLLRLDPELQTISWVAVGMMAVAVGGALVAWRRGTLPGERRWWLPLFLIPFAVLFLLLPVSLPVWNLLPKLMYLQFSWRWLEALVAPTAIFFAAAVWFEPLRKRIPSLAVCGIVFVAIGAAAGRYWYHSCGPNLDRLLAAEVDGRGVYGKPEYTTPDARYAMVPFGQPDACLTRSIWSALGEGKPGADPEWVGERAKCDGSFVAILDPPEHKRITGVANYAGYLVLRLRNYPAWRVTVNGRPTAPAVDHIYGLMAVPVPQGRVNVSVDWGATPDVIAGRWISAIALLLLVAHGWAERRFSRPRVS